jgi:hypothetical protein
VPEACLLSQAAKALSLALEEKEQPEEEEKNMQRRLVISGTLFALALGVGLVPRTSAQSTDNAPPQGTVEQRKINQQDRIANGIQSGQLTAGETKHLERNEAGLNHEERQMRSADDGHLTAADRSQLNRQQNHLSNQIYQDKHNDRTTHYGAGEIGQRRENQQDRIAQGIRSGQMTPGEASRQEGREQHLNREIRNDRAAHGGHLTNTERASINRQQNRQSRQIYREKHNGRKGY